MAPFDAAQEKRLAKAIEFHRQNPHIPKTRVAEKYTVDYSALRNRLNGHLPGRQVIDSHWVCVFSAALKN